MGLTAQTGGRLACPRCGSAMYRGYDQDFCCLFCGEYVYFDARGLQVAHAPTEEPRQGPRKRNRHARVTAAA